LSFHHKKFVCIDQEDMRINGDYSTSKARLMNFQLVKCHGHDYCKSDEEIKAYLRNKFVVMLSNQIRFESRNVGGESVVKESNLDWIPVNEQ